MSTNQPSNVQNPLGVTNNRPLTQDEAEVFRIMEEVRQRFRIALIGVIGCLILLGFLIYSDKEFNPAILAIVESIFGGTIIVIFSYYFKVESKKSRIPIIALVLGILALIIGVIALYRTFNL